MGEILRAGKKPQEGPALLRAMITDCAPQHGITGFERIEDRALRDGTVDFKLDIAANLRQRSEMRREYDSDHRGVIIQIPPFPRNDEPVVTPASAPRPKAQLEDHARLGPSSRPRRPTRTPVLR